MSHVPTNSLDRALVLLDAIAATPDGLTNIQISREFGIAPSTCTYILSRLEKEGYLVREKSTGKYRIGLKNVILGRTALQVAGFRSVSEPTLYRLAIDTGLAANIAVLQGSRVVLLDRVEGPPFVKAALGESDEDRGAPRSYRGFKSDYLGRDRRDIGSELPIYTTAMGRVLVAHLPEAEVEAFIEHEPPPEKGARLDKLLLELQKVRQQGYCLLSFEPHNESCALAAPIFDASETVKAAVAVSCRRHLPVWKDENALSELVKEAAWEISCRLHYPKFLNASRVHTRNELTAKFASECRAFRRPS